MNFYEAGFEGAAFLELPAFQYGPLLTSPPRRNFSLLESIRPFLESGFGWKGVVVPRAAILLANNPTGVPPFSQVEDTVQLPPGSWLLGFSAFSAQAAGFRFNVYDVGAKDYALSDKYLQNNTDAQDGSEAGAHVPSLLAKPYCLCSPGTLQVRLVNSANVNNDCQLLMHFAVPGQAAKRA